MGFIVAGIRLIRAFFNGSLGLGVVLIVMCIGFLITVVGLIISFFSGSLRLWVVITGFTIMLIPAAGVRIVDIRKNMRVKNRNKENL